MSVTDTARFFDDLGLYVPAIPLAPPATPASEPARPSGRVACPRNYGGSTGGHSRGLTAEQQARVRRALQTTNP